MKQLVKPFSIQSKNCICFNNYWLLQKWLVFDPETKKVVVNVIDKFIFEFRHYDKFVCMKNAIHPFYSWIFHENNISCHIVYHYSIWPFKNKLEFTRIIGTSQQVCHVIFITSKESFAFFNITYKVFIFTKCQPIPWTWLC